MSVYSLELGFEAPAQDFLEHAAHYLNGSASPRQMLVPDTVLQAAIEERSAVIASRQRVERSNAVNQTASFANVKQGLTKREMDDHLASPAEASSGPSFDEQSISKAKASLRGSGPGNDRSSSRVSPKLPKLKTPSPGARRVRRPK